jgi:hypothetical protein
MNTGTMGRGKAIGTDPGIDSVDAASIAITASCGSPREAGMALHASFGWKDALERAAEVFAGDRLALAEAASGVMAAESADREELLTPEHGRDLMAIGIHPASAIVAAAGDSSDGWQARLAILNGMIGAPSRANRIPYAQDILKAMASHLVPWGGGKSDAMSLPDGIVTRWGLSLREWGHLRGLPADCEVMGDIDLSYTHRLRSLPASLSVSGMLNLRASALDYLPDGLAVEGGLLLAVSAIISLPSGLRVGDFLDLRDCEDWDGIIPPDASIGGQIMCSAHPKGISLASWRRKYADKSCVCS